MKRSRDLRPAMAALGVLSLAAASCGRKSTEPPPPPPPGYLLVLNTLGETLDRIDLSNGQVTPAVATLGNAPNDLRVDVERGRVWVANSADNEVAAYDLTTFQKVLSVPLGPNSNPWNLLGGSDGLLLVTNWLAGDVAVIDPATGGLLTRYAVGRAPEALLPGSSASNFTVSLVNYDATMQRFGPGEVITICPVCGRPPQLPVRVGTNPQTLFTGPDGHVHVVCTGNFGGYEPAEWGEIRVLDWPGAGQQDTLRLGGTPDHAEVVGDMVYVSAYYGGLMKYDGRTHEILRDSTDPILNLPGLAGMAKDEARHRLYVAGAEDDNVYVVDTTADTLVATWPVGDIPIALVRVETATPAR